MSLLKSGIALMSVSVILAACSSPSPLAKDEIPPDFLLTYEMTVRTPAMPPAAEPAEKPALEAELPPEPTRVFIEVKFPGHVDYELTFPGPDSAMNEGSLELPERDFRHLYDAVRAADLFGMQRRIVGEDAPGFRESFTVRGNLHFARIEASDTHDPKLTALFTTLKGTLTSREPDLFGPPKVRTAAYILDRRTLEFHRADCPRVKDIPKEARILFHSVERCLDEGGEPCETCHPLRKR